MALADRAELAVRLTLDDRAFSSGLRRSQGALGKFGASAGRVGKGVGQLGVGLARIGYTAAVATAGGLAIVARKSIEWESALAGVNKTMDLTPEQLATIGNEIRLLSTQVPLAATEIAGLAEQAGALGIAAGDVVEFSRVAATLGVTTDVAADQAASSLGVLATLLGLTGDEFERTASTLVDLGNKGSSTESAILAIAERAAGAGATIGLTTEQLLAFSAAAANIGIEPEAGGSSLQKFFLETLKAINAGGKELDTFAKTAGTTTSGFEKLFKEDPGAALESFIQGLGDLGKGKRLDVLDALGFSDIRITRMLLGLAEAESKTESIVGTISDSLNVSAAAWKTNTAAAEEADKRYGTVASKIELLKNQAIEAGLQIGEGFLPALGRMADKLKAILADPAQTQVLRDFGKDIGTIIDGIDFQKVIAGARVFLGAIKTLWGILRLIPVEIHAAVLAFAGLNKLSGGLVGAGIGNIIGGLTESVGRSLFTKIPGIGKFGALPVYVTNLGPGGLGGGAAAAGGGVKGFFGRAATGVGGALGGGAALGAAAIAASGAALVGALAAVQKLVVEPALQREAGENISDVQAVIATGDAAQIQAALDGVRAGVANLDPLKSILYNLNADGVKVHTESLIGALEQGLVKAQVAGLNRSGSPDERQFNNDLLAKQEKQQGSLDRMRDRIEANRIAIQTGTAKVTTKQEATRTAVTAAKIAQITANHSDTARLIGAIHAARPIVSVVVNAATNYTTTVRTGQTRTRSSSDPQSKYSPKDY